MFNITAMIFLNIFDGIGKFFDAIMQPLYWAVSGILAGIHHLVAAVFGTDSGITWTLSIVVLTLILRLILMPLYAKQLNSSRGLQTLQPKLKEIQDKYGSDRERVGRETMKLYKEEGVSPTSSCGPVLVQLPIFWALYRVLYNASIGKALGYWFEINPKLAESLSNATIFHAKLSGQFLPFKDGFGPTQILALLLIVVMTGVLFVQQLHMMRRNMPPTAMEGPLGQQQKMLMYLMPLMFVFIGLAIPIGVLIYWAITNIWTFAQQYFIIRNYPTPNTPAYVEWEERMIAAGKDPKEIERHRSNRGRKRKLPATPAPATDESGKTKVVRQKGVTRQTVRSDASGKQVVQRQQVVRQSRAARKKK